MRKFTLLTIIILACSSYSFSQDFNFSKEVEERVVANKKAGLDVFDGVYKSFEMNIWGVNSVKEANDLDLVLMKNYANEIVSSSTKYNKGNVQCVLQVFGNVSADRVKEILLSNHADFEEFDFSFILKD